MGMLRWLLLLALLGLGPAAAQNFQADNALSVFSEIVTNNVTAVQVCKSPCRLYQVDGFNSGSTVAFVKLYNAATATCGTGTPQWRGMIPGQTGGSGFVTPWVNGDSYSLGAWVCVTTGIADADVGVPASSTYLLNLHFKPTGQANPSSP